MVDISKLVSDKMGLVADPTSGEMPFLCFLCGQRFTQSPMLKQHLLMHSIPAVQAHQLLQTATIAHRRQRARTPKLPHIKTEPSPRQSRRQQASSSEKSFRCPQCEKSFDFRAHWKVHVANVHQIRNAETDTAHKCVHCQKQFYSKCHLLRHMRVHSGDKPFKCLYCDMTCARKDNCMLHMLRVHHKGNSNTDDAKFNSKLQLSPVELVRPALPSISETAVGPNEMPLHQDKPQMTGFSPLKFSEYPVRGGPETQTCTKSDMQSTSRELLYPSCNPTAAHHSATTPFMVTKDFTITKLSADSAKWPVTAGTDHWCMGGASSTPALSYHQTAPSTSAQVFPGDDDSESSSDSSSSLSSSEEETHPTSFVMKTSDNVQPSYSSQVNQPGLITPASQGAACYEPSPHAVNLTA